MSCVILILLNSVWLVLMPRICSTWILYVHLKRMCTLLLGGMLHKCQRGQISWEYYKIVYMLIHFLSTSSVHYWERSIKLFNNNFNFVYSLKFQKFLFRVFGSCVIVGLHIWNCYVFLTKCSLYHSEISFCLWWYSLFEGHNLIWIWSNTATPAFSGLVIVWPTLLFTFNLFVFILWVGFL